MGLFRKHRDENSEDFILNFNIEDDRSEIENAQPTEITPWDKREHITAPHAMTVDEILGKSTQNDTNTVTEKDGEHGETEPEFTADSQPEKAADTVPESIVIPKDAEPIFEKSEFHAETEEISTNVSDTAEENFEEYIKGIKVQSLKNYGIELPQNDVFKKDEKSDEESEQNALSEKIAENENKDEAEKHRTEKQSPEIQKTESAKLSPMAQQLYDRMMAERAKSTLRKEHSAAESAIFDETPEQSPEKENRTATESESIPAEDVTPPDQAPVQSAEETPKVQTETKAVSNAQEQETENRTTLPAFKSTENIADAIFESLNDNLFKAPLSHHGIGDSLLDKCKSFVKKEPVVRESIDDIIHDAEKNARERLFKAENDAETKYDFGMFSEKTDETEEQDDLASHADNADKKSSIFENENNDGVKNLQYSLADEDLTSDIAATRRIDITLDKDEANNIELNAEDGRRAAPEKIEEIKLHLEKLAEKEPPGEVPHLNLTGEEEAQLPENDVKSFENDVPVLDDYNSIDDLESVTADLAGKKVGITAKLLPTAFITAALFIIDYILKGVICNSSVTVYGWLNLILFAGVFVINFNTVKGLSGLVMGAPDMDTPYAISAAAVLLYTFVTVLLGTAHTLPSLCAAGALALLFNLIGKYSMIKRISRGFKTIANNRVKNAVTFVEDKLSASVMAGGSVIGEALICEGKPTTNVTGYLNNSYSDDAYEKKVTPLVVFTVIAATLCAVAAVIAGNDIYGALFAFCCVCVAACPVSAILVCNLPLGFASKKLKAYGAMIAGYKGADTISNANAVAFSAQQLFPEGTIKLYHIQVLSSCVVDEYVGYAAGVLKAANSPLAPVFTEMLETIDREAPFADSIKYENGMGVSGWVEDKHVFIGNRTLMEGHNIHTPALELDKKILRQGYFPLYFAIDQQLYALFIIGYEADENITYELRRLCSTGVTMLVNSNDPNITDEMLCDYFGLYKGSIKVLSPSGVTAYNTVNQYKDSVSAPAAYGDDLNGFLATVTAAIKIKSISSALLIMQIVFMCLGVGAVGYLTLTASLLKLPSLIISAVQLGFAAITALVAKLNQP